MTLINKSEKDNSKREEYVRSNCYKLFLGHSTGVSKTLGKAQRIWGKGCDEKYGDQRWIF